MPPDASPLAPPAPRVRVIRVDASRPDPDAVAEAAAVLRRGGLVGLPTETVYGLAARALDPRAVARVFEAKGRPAHHPLIAHVLDEDQARELASVWPPHAARLAGAFWPGPLTLVVERAVDVPSVVSGGGSSLAVRAPSHAVARAVLSVLGEPIAAPSANRYQGLSATAAWHVVAQLGDAVDLVLDAGDCEAGIESTVVDVRGRVPRVLRPGAVGIGALRAVVDDIAARAEERPGPLPRASPGLDARHYAPRAPLLLSASYEQATRAADELADRHRRVGLVVRAMGQSLSPGVLVRELPCQPEGYARQLYATLHDLDDAGVEVIVVQAVPDDDAWWAVADRLRRAATRKDDD